jgi:hypothetical protein
MAPGQPSPLLLCAQRNLAATAEVCLRYGVPVRAPSIHCGDAVFELGLAVLFCAS